MKYSLLFLLLCLVFGFDLVNPDDTGDAFEKTSVNTKALPGYMGDMVIGGQRFESYLVPVHLDVSTIDQLTARTREWISITSTTARQDGSSHERKVLKSTPDIIDELVMSGEIRIWFRYTTGSGEVVDNQVECEKTTFEKDGTELQCVDVLAKDNFTVHVVPRLSS